MKNSQKAIILAATVTAVAAVILAKQRHAQTSQPSATSEQAVVASPPEAKPLTRLVELAASKCIPAG